MKKILSVLLLALAFSFSLAAVDAINVKAGPWVTNVSETGFNVVWTTENKCISFVELAPDDGTAFNSCERPRYYQTVSGRAFAGTVHNVRINGLKPGTSYRYRMFMTEVKDDSKAYDVQYGRTLRTTSPYWEDFSVRTFDLSASRCRFSMVNDIHFDEAKYADLLAGRTASDMDFLLLGGDIASQSDHIDSVAKYTFGPVRKLLYELPVVYARGNHESRGRAFAEVPYLTPTPSGQFYYIFRQGPVAFVVLDASEDKPDNSPEYFGYAHFDQYRAEELEWLKTAVKDPLFVSAPVKVAVMHIPPRTDEGAWHTERWLAANFVPVLNEAGVRLMLSAHKHKYHLYGKDACGNDFPILVNSHVDRLDFDATSSRISVKIVNREGKEIKSLSF